MAPADHITAQFQEPPVANIPEARNTSTPQSDISTQFREPTITPSPSNDSATDDPEYSDTTSHKTTTEKLKEALKKPLTVVSSSSNHSSSSSQHKLGQREITSPEMAAANEVLVAKDLK